MYYSILKFMPLGPTDQGDSLLLYYITAGDYALGNLKPVILWGWEGGTEALKTWNWFPSVRVLV